MIIFGIYSISAAKADCGGQTMQAGDTCQTSGAGGSVTRSANQQLTQDREEGWGETVFGTVMLLAGGAVLFSKNEGRGRPRAPREPTARRPGTS